MDVDPAKAHTITTLFQKKIIIFLQQHIQILAKLKEM